ncbi:MAG: extracellular solute-binding protein [Deltaproteobacteria bacterium]|nr:extracellular solute-binding protein [Deltaproteobacteria bacterium]
MKRLYCMSVLVLVLGLFNVSSGWGGWQEDWERTVQAAKKEGKVSMFGPTGTARRDALVRPFEKKFGISVEFLGGRVTSFPPKISAERRAGHFGWDLIVAGALEALFVPMKIMAPLEPVLILPEVKNMKNWRGGQLEFLDSGRTAMVMSPYTRGQLFINPSLVRESEFKSYKDLLNPKWKGKIVVDDPLKPGPGSATFGFFYLHPELGKDFIRKLLKQDLLILKNYGQEIDMIGAGKRPVGIGLSESIAEARQRQGIPVMITDPRKLKEGSDINPAVGQVGVFKQPAHPNAAKVYINWLLSKEGQTEFARATGYISARLDVPTDHVPYWRVPVPGAIKTYGIEYREIVKKEMVPFVKSVMGR